MGSKFGSLVDNVKNIKTNTIFNLASQAVYKAKSLSKEEIKVVLEKISQVEQKTNTEIEKVASIVVGKLLKDKNQAPVSEDVKNEIVHTLIEHNKGKNLIPIFKYVNNVLLTNIPKNIKAAKNFKSNVANTLINDANKRLEAKKIPSTPSKKSPRTK